MKRHLSSFLVIPRGMTTQVFWHELPTTLLSYLVFDLFYYLRRWRHCIAITAAIPKHFNLKMCDVNVILSSLLFLLQFLASRRYKHCCGALCITKIWKVKCKQRSHELDLRMRPLLGWFRSSHLSIVSYLYFMKSRMFVILISQCLK